MAKRVGGNRRKTRKLFSKSSRQKGKLPLAKYLQEYQPGERVTLLAEPSIQHGLYNPRYHGRVAKILAKRGKCYEVEINDYKLKKMLIVHPVHMVKKVQER